MFVHRSATVVQSVWLFQTFADSGCGRAYTYRPFMFAVPMLILTIESVLFSAVIVKTFTQIYVG